MASAPGEIALLQTSEQERQKDSRIRLTILALLLLLSIGLVYWAVPDWTLVIIFAATIAAGSVLIWFSRLSTAVQQSDEEAAIDWTLTRLIADQSDIALGVTDRAGRLVCANDLFLKWFDGPCVPPDIPVTDDSRSLLASAGRTAWRDGRGYAEGLKRGAAEYDAQVTRAGHSEQFLLWSFTARSRVDIIDETVRMVCGGPGRALAQSGIMVAILNGEGRLRASNAAFAERATGRGDANIAGRNFTNFMRADDRGAIFFEREGPHGIPVRMFHVPLDRQKDPPEAMVLLIDDDGGIAERAQALEQVEAMLSLLPLGLALTDRDGRLLFINDAFRRIAALQPDETPLYPGDLVIKDDKAAVGDAVRRYAGGQARAGDLAVRLSARGDDPVALGIAGVRGLGEAAVLLSIKDNSEENKLKTQVAQQTKMEAVGQLAGGVAHDFNNILTAIIGHCDLMLLRHVPGDSDYDDIQQIRNNSNRAAGLTRQLLAFSRQQTMKPQVLQLPDVVSDVANLLKRLLTDNIELEVHHGRDLGPIRADPGQLEQVIINLGVNARDAMPKGGTITLATSAVSAGQVREMGNEILPIGDYTRLTVVDTGKGIAPENIGKIFEPFFTTKDVGKGTGLGLSTVYGIVKQSGGYIFVDSPPGHGATFSLYFPVHRGVVPADDRTAAPGDARAPKREIWGTGRILLVEDEDMVRAVGERALTRQGYEVVTAADGEEGLAKLASEPAFDLIVSDVMMPNMDGPTMAKRARGQFPDLPILFMSGYAEAELRQSIRLDDVAFLPKPFSVAQIADAVGAILSEKGPEK